MTQFDQYIAAPPTLADIEALQLVIHKANATDSSFVTITTISAKKALHLFHRMYQDRSTNTRKDKLQIAISWCNSIIRWMKDRQYSQANSGWDRDANAIALIVSELPRLQDSVPDDLRDAGLAVAVHNDYRLNGEPHTFWLMTRGNIAFKGEGRTDAAALNQIRAAITAAKGGRT